MAKNIIVILLILLNRQSFSQQAIGNTNFYRLIKSYNLSKLWCAKKIKLVDDDNKLIDFPEPLGYIGKNYQRFYIHYTSVVKDSINPYLYHVTGKTRVKNNICPFEGTIIVAKAFIDRTQIAEPVQEHTKATSFREGQVVCNIKFTESDLNAHTGTFTGTIVSDWMIDKSNHLIYNTVEAVGDGYSNNQTTAMWTDNKTKISQPCAWGDYRIPYSNQLDTGTGEFIVNNKYVQNGWESYNDMMYAKGAKQKAAIREENRKWWQ